MLDAVDDFIMVITEDQVAVLPHDLYDQVLFTKISQLIQVFDFKIQDPLQTWLGQACDPAVSDMLSKNKIIGMTENEIINFLGEETETHPQSFKSPISVYSDENTLIYELGSKYIDYEWLIIKLNNGIVIDYDFGLT